MKYCPKCSVSLVDDAKFCHNCGARVDIPVIICQQCDKKNPATALFCYHCARPLGTLELDVRPSKRNLNLTFEDETILEDEFKSLFFHILKVIAELIAPEKYSEYLEQFYLSGFNRTIDLRTRQLSENYHQRFNRSPAAAIAGMEREIEGTLETLVMQHIVRNCKEINAVQIPESIVRYENAQRGKVDIRAMVIDFLDFAHERERVYSDFVRMPTDKMKNAAVNFLYAAKEEMILFISDQSLLGTCKDGFAMTEFGLYWKAPMERAQRIYYHDLREIKKHKSWITINGKFFNINASLNIKMILLLNKLRMIYAQ